MKKYISLFWVFFVAGITVCVAQTKTITGVVIEKETDMGMPGVTVVIPGTTTGTVTDMDGNFSLTIDENTTTLQVSFVGMQTQMIQLDARNHYVVMLQNESVGLDEVIAVAYGTTKKSSFTGAASVVKGESLTKMQSANLSNSLEGTLAGVQVTQSSGQPGSGGSIIVRGLGSLNASLGPLIILDGVPYEANLSTIPSQDIESMTVLKDAAANSMYGARGANGVILITTKRGKSGAVQIDFDSRVGINTRGISNYDVITDPAQYYELSWAALRNSYANKYGYVDANFLATQDLITNSLKYNVFAGVADDELIDPYTGRINPNATTTKWGKEWDDEAYNTGIRQEYRLSLSGGAKKSDYYLSVGYLNDQGIISGSEFDRFNARIKVNQKIGNRIQLSANIGYTGNITNSSPASSGSQSNVFMFTQSVAPIYPVYLYDLNTGDPIYHDNGKKIYDYGVKYGRPFGTLANPVATNQLNINENKSDNLTFRGSAVFNLFEGLTLTVNGAHDLYFNYTSTFTTPFAGDGAALGGLGYKTMQRYISSNFNQLLNYEKSFSDHTFKVLIGHENKENSQNYLSGSKYNFYDPTNPEFSNGVVTGGLGSGFSEYKLEGYLSRIEYDYTNKYYLSGSFRRDGSSIFHPDSRWGNFWSVGASWRVSQESFMADVAWVNDLKLRSSYGTQGNDNVNSWYGFQDQYIISTLGTDPAALFDAHGNPDLTWEKSNNFNVGVDIYTFNRFSLTAEYWIRTSKDLLFQESLPLSEGKPHERWRNYLDLRNRGIDFELSARVINKENLTWTVNLNASHYKNEILSLPPNKDPNGYVEGAFWWEIGGSRYDFYDYEYAGVDKETGKALYYQHEYDHYGNMTRYEVDNITDATMINTGRTSIPDVTGGVSSQLTYKNFDFSVNTAFQIGGTVFDSNYQSLMGSKPGANYHKDMLHSWSLSNTNTEVPIVMHDYAEINSTSDRFYTSASYFNFKNITIGYNFSSHLLDRIGVGSARVYLVGDNLWLQSARKGLDPRQSLNGSVGFNYSTIRTVSLGLSIKI